MIPYQKEPGTFVESVEQNFSNSPTLVYTPKPFRVQNTMHVDRTNSQLLKGQVVSYTNKSSSYSPLLTDYVVGIASTTAVVTVTLPPAAAAGRGKVFVIKDIGGSATSNNITIDPNGSELINGQATFPLSTNYDTVRVICDGTQWYTL